MPNNEAKIILSLEDQQFVKEIRAAIVDAKAFEEAVKNVKNTTKSIVDPAVTGSVKDLSQRLTDARNQLYSSIPATKEYENALKRVTALSNLLGQAQSTTSQRLKETSQNYKQVSDIVSSKPIVNESATGSIKDLSQRLSDARNQLYSAVPASKEYENALKRVTALSNLLNQAQSESAKKLKETAQQYNTSTNSLKQGSDKAGYALLQIGRIAQDAPYGFTGIANNLQFTSECMIQLVRETGSVKAAFSSVASSFIGPMGIMFAISVVTSAITYFSMHTKSAKTATDALKESVDKLKDSLANMSRDTLNALIMAEQAKIRTLEALSNQEVNKVMATRGLQPTSYKAKRGLTDDEQAKLNAANESLKLLKQELITLGLIDNQRRKVNELEKSWISARSTADKDARKLALDDAKKQLDQLEGNTKDTYKKTLDSELQLHALRYELGREDFNTYKNFLNDKLKSLKQNSLEELEVRKKYRDAYTGLYKSVTPESKPEFMFGNESQDKAFETLKKDFERQGLPWDEKAKALVLRVVMTGKPEVKISPFEMKPVSGSDKNPNEETWKLTQEELDDVKFKADLTKTAFTELGNSIIDAMTGAKISIGEVVTQIGVMIAKLLLAKAIEAGINSIFPGAGTAVAAVASFASHEIGGVIGYGPKKIYADPAIFYGAEHYSTGGSIDGVPIIGHKGEIILNEKQQSNLLNLISGLASYKLRSSRVVQEVRVSGRLTADRMNFIGEVNSAQTDYNNTIAAGGFDRA